MSSRTSRSRSSSRDPSPGASRRISKPVPATPTTPMTPVAEREADAILEELQIPVADFGAFEVLDSPDQRQNLDAQATSPLASAPPTMPKATQRLAVRLRT